MLNRIVTIAALAAGGVILSRQLKKSRGLDRPSSIKKSIKIDAPVSAVYEQWSQFEDFPKFMDNVREVRQLDDTHLRWRAEIAGKEEHWDSEITERIPEQRIAWRSTSGAKNAGAISFHKISDSKTRVTLQMDYEPRAVSEELGAALGAVKMDVKGNLQRVKELLERRAKEIGVLSTTPTQH